MADPLSITASVIAVATAGMVVAKGLNKIVDDMGSASEEVRIYASDIRTISIVLQGIAELLQKKARQSWSKAERVIEDILHVCNNFLVPMNKIQANLAPLLEKYKHNNKKLWQVRARIWWLFQYKEKMQLYGQSLQNLNLTLNTHLAAMKLDAVDNATINISVRQSTLQLCVAEAETSLHNKSRPQLMSNITSPRRAIEDASTSKKRKRSSLPANGVVQSQVQGTAGPEMTDPDNNADTIRTQTRVKDADDMSQALILYPEEENDLGGETDGLNAEEAADVESTILGTVEGEPDNFVEEIREDLGAVLRKVVRYAKEVHRASTERGTPLTNENVNLMPPKVSVDEHVEFHKIQNIDNRIWLFPFDVMQDWHNVLLTLQSMKFPDIRMQQAKYTSLSIIKSPIGLLHNASTTSVPIDVPFVLNHDMFFLVHIHHDGKKKQWSCIPQQFWSQLIHPGQTVELQFDESIEWRDSFTNEWKRC